jgi:type I restriction enzyme R subunit
MAQGDLEWDGEPQEPEPPGPGRPGGPKPGPDDPLPPPGEPEPKKARLVIKLADGKERSFQHISATTFWSVEGRPISA